MNADGEIIQNGDRDPVHAANCSIFTCDYGRFIETLLEPTHGKIIYSFSSQI